MKIYDISQEVFNCCVFPGDSHPEREEKMKIENGDICNLTAISMCAHNGTHVDSPYHFYKDGKTIDQLELIDFIGFCFVVTHDGNVSAEDAEQILEKAREAAYLKNRQIPIYFDCQKRILLRGKATVTEEAARVFAENGVRLIGNESQTVGPENAPAKVHYILLEKEIVLLEGIRLGAVPEGIYLLNAAPINLGGSDGAPCRAVLLETDF